MGRIKVAISSHCNLNCKGCDVYAPLAREEFVKDMNKLKEIAPNHKYYTAFLGGEPLKWEFPKRRITEWT